MSGTETALRLLPEEIAKAADEFMGKDPGVTEFRLRMGQYPGALLDGKERTLPTKTPVSAADLRTVWDRASHASPYASLHTLEQGYITAGGGVRVGFAGRVGAGHGGPWAGGITSCTIRIPRAVVGCARQWAGVEPVSTLIVSPPGGGKTTLLRDMIRLWSDSGIRVGLCDEREEIAALSSDGPGFDVGRHTDILSDCPKSRAAQMLLRTMNPQVIAMDEITAPEDAEACIFAAHSGVELLATCHGTDRDELLAKNLYRHLFSEHVFRRLLLIRGSGRDRRYEEVRL